MSESKLFCNFCKCKDCKEGRKGLSHAEIKDNKWICDICYYYDVCMDGPERNSDSPCAIKTCKHRPILIGNWILFK